MIDQAKLRKLKTVGEFMPFFLESRVDRNLRATTMINLNVWALWMVRHWGDKQVRRVTDGQIIGLAKSKSRNHAQLTQCFFRWLISVKALSPLFYVGVLPQPPRSDERSISYLSPDDARRFVAAVKEEYRAGFILGLWAGLRPYEMCRIEWPAIQLAQRRIRIEARVSKIRRSRMVEGVPAVLWQMLRPLAKTEGRVMPGTDDEIVVFRYIHERKRAAKRAGVALSHDVFRHTFATFFTAWTGHSAMCAKILGHYKLGTLAAHYDGVATKAEAKDYFTAR